MRMAAIEEGNVISATKRPSKNLDRELSVGY
jgi:hypothetical protein